MEKKSNRLINETSPYLLEHAYNPVDWWPWSEEAFNKAAKLNKPVFLSVGYSSCHWCHIMRKESFEDEATAALMNKHFINIKLDREERPDIDHQYQLLYQLVNQRGGGWPLSMWLTPTKEPIYAGTYFPKQARYGMPGFTEVIRSIVNAYTSKNAEVLTQASQLAQHATKIGTKAMGAHEVPAKSYVKSAYVALLEIFDRRHGGFSGAPKFPHESSLWFLLEEAGRSGDKAGIKALIKTLDEMIDGGIYDQLGGGFHRYTVDREWLVPHFEKMLYNQAQMVPILLEAYRLTGNKRYQQVAEETLEYVSREMSDSSGGFYSAQNADSGEHGKEEEGEFFVWQLKELEELLGDKQHPLLSYYETSKNGNWEGKIILRVVKTMEEVASKTKLSIEATRSAIEAGKKILFEHRKSRIPASTDTKVLTSWSALMARGYIKASRIQGKSDKGKKYWNVAIKCLDFLTTTMLTDDQLYRVYNKNQKKILGFLDDYHYVIAALLDAFEASLDIVYLNKAITLFKQSVTKFGDKMHGGFYYSGEDHVTPISRFKDVYDSALSSPNSIAIQNSLRLAFFDEDNSEMYRIIAEKSLKSFGQIAHKGNALGMAEYFFSLSLWHNFFSEVTIVIPEDEKNISLWQQISKIWIPFRLQIDVKEKQFSNNELASKSWLKGKKMKNAMISAYICQNFTCSLPMTTIEEFNVYINKIN